jgi:Tfp pilus assembly protein PilO
VNEKQFTIIWVVALALIIIAGCGAIYYLQFEVLEQKKQELAAVQSQVADAAKKKRDIKGLQDSIAALEKKESELITHIPNMTRAEYDVFAELLDELRRKAGVSVSRAGWMVPTRPTPIPGRPATVQPATVHKVQYDITVTGTFYQLLRYVNLLEQHRRFIGVESFSITKGGGIDAKGAALPRRDMRVTIYSYTYKLPAQPFEIPPDEGRSGKSTDLPE